jgi:trans-aconitate methyltransferase
MFDPPRKLEHLTEHFQSLCDAVMDLEPQSLIAQVPDDLLECAHLIVLADASVVRECANAAELLSKATPHDIANVVMEHHRKITHYLFIRSMILDGNQSR